MNITLILHYTIVLLPFESVADPGFNFGWAIISFMIISCTSYINFINKIKMDNFETI